MGLTYRPCQKVKPNSCQRCVVISADHVTACHQTLSSCEFFDPLGGVSVQPSTDAGTGQAAASGEGERGVTGSPEARAKESSKLLLFIIATSSPLYILQRRHKPVKQCAVCCALED